MIGMSMGVVAIVLAAAPGVAAAPDVTTPAVDCNEAISKAVAEWKAKEHLPRHLDHRSRVADDLPIAKALADACGRSGVPILQQRFRDQPHEVMMLAVDQLGASDAIAQCLVEWLSKELKVALASDPLKTHWWIRTDSYPAGINLTASLCSPATCHAVARALATAKMPPTKLTPCGDLLDSEYMLSFLGAVGDGEIARALEAAANHLFRANRRDRYLDQAEFIRRREALPPAKRAVRAKDDLLLWQAASDQMNYANPDTDYLHSARTQVALGQRISTEYLLEWLRPVSGRPRRDVRYRYAYHMHLLIIYLLGEQGDPAAIPTLEEVAGNADPEYAKTLRFAIQRIREKSRAK